MEQVTTMLVLFSLFSLALSLPPHHLLHKAPRDLHGRSQKSNPMTLRHDDTQTRPVVTSNSSHNVVQSPCPILLAGDKPDANVVGWVDVYTPMRDASKKLQLFDGKPVYRAGHHFMYYRESGSMWAVSTGWLYAFADGHTASNSIFHSCFRRDWLCLLLLGQARPR